jgi:hypothetical protein
MKFKVLLMVVLMSAFSLVVCGQDELLDYTVATAPVSDGNIDSIRVDKGRKVEDGLFFTKSTYGSADAPSDASSDQEGTRKLSKTFELTVEQSGDYFFAAHILPANNVEKINAEKISQGLADEIISDRIDLLEVEVYLNEQYIGALNQSQPEWELAPLKEEKTVWLQAGKNVVRFESDAPYYPMIDAVRITESEKALVIKNDVYDDFITYLKSNPNRSLPAEKETQDDVDLQLRENVDVGNVPSLRSAMFPNDNNWQMVPYVFPAPEGLFGHRMNVPITYTYHRLLSLSAGNYTFNTAPISGDSNSSVDPVMYLYKVNDPHNYSWYNDDYNTNTNGLQSWISVSNIPAGDYYLVVRAFNSSFASTELGRQGLVNVYQNGSLLNSNAPVAGVLFDVSHDTSNRGNLDYFTAYATGIPIFFLLQNLANNTYKMKFKGETLFYLNSMDYLWFDDARMQLDKSSSDTYSMLVSAEGAMGFYFGNCDAYGNVLSDVGNILTSSNFPNLKAADAMRSAPANGVYNCTAWAGGIYDGWVWHYQNNTSLPVVYTINNSIISLWNTWDDYFGNNPSRYAGATTYTRDQANAGNAEIALWSTNGAFSGIQHASVRLLANNNPHGYAWESKIGPNYRIFHPKNALENPNFYGSIFAYYRDISKDPSSLNVYSASVGQDNSERTNILALRAAKRYSNEPVFTMKESIEKGLTVIEKVKLEPEQLSLVRSKSAMLSASVLQSLYDNWVKKIKSPEMSCISNVYSFIETEEGKQLIDYAKNNLEESIVFFANVVFANEEATFEKFIAEYLFCEIARENYAFILEEIKDEWEMKNYDSQGRYIAPMPETFAKKYIKRLLDKVVLKKGETSNAEIDAVDSHSVINIAPNPVDEYAAIHIDLPQKATVSVRIFNQASQLMATVLNSRALENGKHSFSLDTDGLSKGLYVCIVEINGKLYSRKLLKR